MDKDTLELIISKVTLTTNCNDVIINCVWAAVIAICILTLCYLAYRISVLYIDKLEKKQEEDYKIKLMELELKEKENELSSKRIDYNHELQKLDSDHKHGIEMRELELKEKIELSN